MIYQMYQSHTDLMDPSALDGPASPARHWACPGAGATLVGDRAEAVGGLRGDLRCMGTTHTRPAFGIRSVIVGHREVAGDRGGGLPRRRSVRWCASRRISQSRAAAGPDRGAAVGPLRDPAARHGARRCCAEHDVYITDWHNARDVPLSDGRFDFDDYVDHLIAVLRGAGPRRACGRGLPALRSRCSPPSR